MFRRLQKALPRDPIFESDLKKLGYFVNDNDEIRSIENPKFFYKFFFNRNKRYNERKRFHFNEAIELLIHERLEAEGLQKVILPLGTETTEPHLPIFLSQDIESKSRVVVIFGESHQELGVLAHRVIGGAGGINKGSMTSIVQALKEQASSKSDTAAPGIVLANMGETWWWPEGKRALNPRGSEGAPMKSAVQKGRYYDPTVNAIAGSERPEDHAAYIFEKVLPKYVNSQARVDLVVLGDAAHYVEWFLNDDGHWATWGPRLSSMSIVGGSLDQKYIECGGFKKFLAKKARAWTISGELLNEPLSGPERNENTTTFMNFGCPVFSSGEPETLELAFIKCQKPVLNFIQEVALTTDFTNPEIVVTFADNEEVYDTWADEHVDEEMENMLIEKLDKMELDKTFPESDEVTQPMHVKEDGEN